MAFLFYTEPARTYDLDVFVLLPPQNSVIFSMEPLYQEMQRRGYAFDAEHILIQDTPVQFIPAYNALAEEKAVEQALLHNYDEVPVRVISPEHLIALVYQTGGKHRLIRAEALLAEREVDENKLEAILSKHSISRRGEG